MLREAEKLLAGTEPGAGYVIEVPRGKTSQMTGQKRGNVIRLMDEFALKELKIRENPELNGEIRLIRIEK